LRSKKSTSSSGLQVLRYHRNTYIAALQSLSGSLSRTVWKKKGEKKGERLFPNQKEIHAKDGVYDRRVAYQYQSPPTPWPRSSLTNALRSFGLLCEQTRFRTLGLLSHQGVSHCLS
jgi:hypothetical protein